MTAPNMGPTSVRHNSMVDGRTIPRPRFNDVKAHDDVAQGIQSAKTVTLSRNPRPRLPVRVAVRNSRPTNQW